MFCQHLSDIVISYVIVQSPVNFNMFSLMTKCNTMLPVYSFVDIDIIMPACTAVFDTFHPLSCDVLSSLIIKLNKTTCALDPFPTKLLMYHLSSILDIILCFINIFFNKVCAASTSVTIPEISVGITKRILTVLDSFTVVVWEAWVMPVGGLSRPTTDRFTGLSSIVVLCGYCAVVVFSKPDFTVDDGSTACIIGFINCVFICCTMSFFYTTIIMHTFLLFE